MSMQRLANAVRMQAQMNSTTVAQTKMGTVSSYNPADYTVKVTLQPDGNETGWLPLAALGVGQGWGMIFAPGIGDMVEVQFQEGNVETGMVCARFFNDEDRPMAVPSGEFWLVNKQGSFLKFTSDGKVALNGQAEVDMSMPTLNIQATGNVNVMAAGQANITAPAISLGAAGASLLSVLTAAFATLFNGHTHKVNATGAQSDPPLQQANASHMTSTVKAS